MIHQTAIIDPNAKLGSNVSVGPYSIVGADVEIGDGTTIGPHVVIEGPTRIGAENKIYQFASLGGDPQDKKYADEPTLLEIGDRNVIREYCTFSRGTTQGGNLTKLGDDNWVMAYVHIAHDCIVGNNTIFANGTSLAGHVTVDDYSILGGFTLVHQFCSIGAHAFCGMGSAIAKDVPPFVMVTGNPAHPHGLNSEGLKRRGYSAEAMSTLRKAYKVLYRSGLGLGEAIRVLEEMSAACSELNILIEFLQRQTRGIVR